jgi:hypothetical protein
MTGTGRARRGLVNDRDSERGLQRGEAWSMTGTGLVNDRDSERGLVNDRDGLGQ